MYFFNIIAVTLLGSILSADFTLSYETFSRQKRMSNGEITTDIRKYPHIVSLEYYGNSASLSSTKYVCSCTIISKNYVISAASCVDKKQKSFKELKVRAGSPYLKNKGSLHQVINFKIHDKYTLGDKNSGYDLALLKLKEPIVFDATKKSVGMFKPCKKIKPDVKVELSGWGSEGPTGPPSRNLMTIRTKTTNQKSCQGIKEAEFCIINMFSGVGNGDAGSPLVIDNELAGIVSRTYRKIQIYDIFTEVSHYWAWIDSTMKKMGT